MDYQNNKGNKLKKKCIVCREVIFNRGNNAIYCKKHSEEMREQYQRNYYQNNKDKWRKLK